MRLIFSAAMSPSNGQPREAFLERLHSDLPLMRSMRPALRRFGRGKADALLLFSHVEQVVDKPADPRVYEEAFLVDCRKTVDTIPDGKTI